MKNIKFLSILGILAFSCTLPIVANAQIAIKYADNTPQEILAAPNQIYTSKIKILNTSPISDSTIKLYAVDGVRSTTGSAGAKLLSEEQKTIGKWVTFEKSEIILKPNESTEVNFQTKVPSEIPPGTYLGAIAAEYTFQKGNAGQKAQAGGIGMGVTVNTRIILPVKIKVPGETVFNAKTSSFVHEAKDNMHRFIFNVENKGNVATMVTFSIELSNLFGPSEEITDKSIILYTGESVSYPVVHEIKSLFGFYTAKAKINYYEKDIFTGEETLKNSEELNLNFSIIPYNYLLLVIAVIILIVAVFAAKKFKFMALGKKSQTYTVQNGDTLSSIGKANGINWKLLAKLNKIKAPYSLSSGQKIKVPKKK